MVELQLVWMCCLGIWQQKEVSASGLSSLVIMNVRVEAFLSLFLSFSLSLSLFFRDTGTWAQKFAFELLSVTCV